MEWISKLFDVHKLPFKVVLWFFLVASILVFSPYEIVTTLKLDPLMKLYGSYVSLLFIASGCLVVLNIFGWFFGKVSAHLSASKLDSKISNNLHSLDEYEKAVLREFFFQEKNTIRLPMDNSVVVGLYNKNLVKMAGSMGEATLAGMILPYSLSKTAKDTLSVMPNLIDWPIGEPEESERKRLIFSRPGFVLQIQERENLLSRC